MNFSGCHPFTMLIYFIVAIGSVFFNKNPIFLIMSMLSAFIFRFIRKKYSGIIGEIIFYALIILFFTMAVPVVSHNGRTPLFFVNDNAITKEAVFLGFCTGIQFSAAFCWLSNMSDIMTGDMIIFLISGISPKLAAFVSRMMRFVPNVKKQFLSIYTSQKNIHPGYKNYKKKMRLFFRSASVMITWIIENSADISDSMYARGYGAAKRRTSVIYYRFRPIDRNIVIIIVLTLLLTAALAVFDNIGMLFYPEIVFPDFSLTLLAVYILWAIIMLIPYLTEICEEYRWKLLRSKI